MLGSKEEPYPGRVLISFWCDYDNNNFSGQLFFFLVEVQLYSSDDESLSGLLYD